MKIVIIFLQVFGFVIKGNNAADIILSYINESNYGRECNYVHIENALVKLVGDSAQVTCEESYDINGPSIIYCVNGHWDETGPLPRCIKRCSPPPFVESGELQIDGEKDDNGLFYKGTVAKYICNEGFTLSPIESRLRVCEEAIWTGPTARCVPEIKISSCKPPDDIANGYFVSEKGDYPNNLNIGQRLHYNCRSGYILIGSPVQTCLDNGFWSPKFQPNCTLITGDSLDDPPCREFPTIAHASITIIQGYKTEESALSDTVIEVRCATKYRNVIQPCQASRLRCSKGRWMGVIPRCVPAHECYPPPEVPYSTLYSQMLFKTTLNKYPIKAQVTYQCLPGYVLEGNDIFSCSIGGCWSPTEAPICRRSDSNGGYYLEVGSLNSILISMATGVGVLSLLLMICLIVVWKRKKQTSRSVSTMPPPILPPDMGDHATLLHHPDRLALIAFADGMQGGQSALPTYDEATRDRGPSLTVNRFHRPHWPNLAIRRTRNSPNPDNVHVARHGSFASHTPSTRSTGDSMGSTDTVAVSEGSTNVTLDTVSSHSGSQAASCRAHCGSLASFDTGSVINTEDVPLLEENEMEENQACDTISLVLENYSLSDNASHKLSTASADFVN